jgi:hypothetical protein
VVSNVIVPAVVGVILAGASLFGLISSQTGAPAENPANQEIIVYGAR